MVERRRAILKAVREAYPDARVWWAGDGDARSTLWITEAERERMLNIVFDVPNYSTAELVAEILDALQERE